MKKSTFAVLLVLSILTVSTWSIGVANNLNQSTTVLNKSTMINNGNYAYLPTTSIQRTRHIRFKNKKIPADDYATKKACEAFKLFREVCLQPYGYHDYFYNSLIKLIETNWKNSKFHQALLNEFNYYGVFKEYDSIAKKYSAVDYVQCYTLLIKTQTFNLNDAISLGQKYKIDPNVTTAVLRDLEEYLLRWNCFLQLPNSEERKIVMQILNDNLEWTGKKLDDGFLKLIRAGRLNEIPDRTGLTETQVKDVLHFLSQSNFPGIQIRSSMIYNTRILKDGYNWTAVYDNEGRSELSKTIRNLPSNAAQSAQEGINWFNNTLDKFSRISPFTKFIASLVTLGIGLLIIGISARLLWYVIVGYLVILVISFVITDFLIYAGIILLATNTFFLAAVLIVKIFGK